MNNAHWHLVLNHMPVIGMAFAAAAMVYAVLVRDAAVKRLALLSVLVAGITAVPAFLTGEPAEHHVKNMAGIEHERIEEHEEAAELAFWLADAAAVLALLTLSWERLRKQPAPVGMFYATLVTAVAVTALMGRAANLGGEIRHPEIRAGAPEPAPSND